MSSRRSEEHTSNQGYLPRGGACVSCRRRKMKCDGQQPICGQCDRAGRSEDCEYTAGLERSKAQILEENISRLEARIQELQNPDVAIAAIKLHQPYGGPGGPPSGSSRSSVQDPPRPVADKLLNGFLQFSTEFGFFLNVPRFHASMIQALPIGHPSRPAPALILTVYLWGIRISNDPSVKSNEATYLTRAIQEAATALSGNHPKKIMHSLQAEILLANYFFANGRFFEGKYHVANAVSTAVSAGLHKIRSSQPSPTTISPPNDPIEEGERIIGAWTVFNLDKCWAIALESTPNFEHSSHTLAAKVDTPWPLEMEEFEKGRLPQNVRTANTIQNFLYGAATQDVGLSTKAIEAKAVILWERVTGFARSCSQNPEKARKLAVGYSILSAATIRLHTPFSQRSESSRRKRLAAAQVILDIVISLKPRGLVHVNSIMGSVWIEAAQVFFDELAANRSPRPEGSWSGMNPADSEQHLKVLQRAIHSMSEFSINIPLLSK
ncbi:hypothetical protein B0H34DRAFT_784478 [Crassisporium funariophilum]|nr:hypothetical protein B0H34DRAFT_784478 [Crassisporium funariophilum]